MSTNGKVQRYRQFILTLPADAAEQLVADHRAVVADAISRGEVGLDFDRFILTLLEIGRKAVLHEAATPASAPPLETTP